MKGLVLLGRTGSGSVRTGPGDARRASCERHRAGTGGGGSNNADVKGDGVEREEEEDDVSNRSVKVEDWREREEGSVLEDMGTAGGARREEPRVRDCVVCHFDEEEEVEERKSDVRASKGSGFHCASLWIPFRPFVCEAGAESDLAASGGRACCERDRGGGFGEARACGGPVWAVAAVVVVGVGAAC